MVEKPGIESVSTEDGARLSRLSTEVVVPPSATSATGSVIVDAEAERFLAQHLSARNPDRRSWHPDYSKTIRVVRASLDRGEPDSVFEMIWKSMKNGVMNVRQGVLPGEVAEQMRERLVALTLEIDVDGSPSHFDTVMARFESWNDERDLPFVPRALVARAFATIHPDRYHTVVKTTDQDHLIPWFEEHTGFVPPPGGWASRAAALLAHLSRWHDFDADVVLRNTFPWFVFEQLHNRQGRINFKPGHLPRQRDVQIVREASVATLSDRHIAIQDALYRRLLDAHDPDSVATEHATGTGGWADVLVKREDGSFDLYEIKPANSAADAVRQALGQLLEYAYRPGGLKEAALHVVSDAPSDSLTEAYLLELHRRFGLRIAYLQVSAS